MDPPVLFSFVLSPLFALLAVSLFPLFCPLILVLLFPWVYLSLLGLLAWGIAGGLGLPRGGITAVHVAEDLLCCLVLSFVTVGHWVIGRPLNGSCWSLVELFL